MPRIHERSPFNQLDVHIYEPLSLDERQDTTGELGNAIIEGFGTFFPGGLFNSARILIPTKVTTPFTWRGGDRVEILNALDTVWEGEISFIGFLVRGGAEQWIVLECVGFWGRLLGRKSIDKRWADDRVGNSIWKPDSSASGYELASVNREGRLRFEPKNVLWRNGEFYGLEYNMPTGETIKRIKITEELRELSVASPSMVKSFISSSYSDMDNAIDGDNTTFDSRTLGGSDYLYIMCPYPTVTGIDFDLGSQVNNNFASMVVQFWNGLAWTAVTSLADTTVSLGATLGQDGTMTWTAPESIARITIDGVSGYGIRMSPANGLDVVDFNEIIVQGQQEWSIRVVDYVGATTIWERTTTGSSARDSTLGTPRNRLNFELGAKAQQVADFNTEDGYFGMGESIMVYSETGSINLTEIAGDIVDIFTDINSDKTRIDSNTKTLEPFFTEGREFATDVLLRAAKYGDSSDNSWAVYLLPSNESKSPDGKPVLGVSQYLPLSDYDYSIRMDDKNLVQPFQLSIDYDYLANWIVVEHTNEEGNRVTWTPDDISGLRDDTSMNLYNRRDLIVDAGDAGVVAALEYGYRVLAIRKDPRFIITGPIKVQGYIKSKGGLRTPSSKIRAGERIRIEDFMEDLAGETDAGLTFMITKTNYSHKKETCSISTGLPDDLAVYMAQRELRKNAVIGIDL
jgi:hypothetical protein